MTRDELRRVKADARTASNERDKERALRVCDVITQEDLFIGESPNHKAKGTPRQIETRYPASCEGCGENIPLGTEAMWIDNVGCWHVDCWQGESDAN